MFLWAVFHPAGTPTDTPGTPGSQGLSGQQNVKKQKSLKQNETNSEAATPACVSNLHCTQQLPSAPTANRLLKQSSMRDRNRRVRPNKVRMLWSSSVCLDIVMFSICLEYVD